MAAHSFCRDIAIARGEPMEGTGALRAEMLLVRWPRGKWSTAYAGAGMSAEFHEALNRGSAFTPYVTFVDRVGSTEATPQLTFFPQSIALSSDDETELIAAIDAWIAGEPVAGTPEPRTTILCCTDSGVDACCARYGFATYKALLAEADTAQFNILQSVHIGGCHFATSIAVAGRRERYGRLEPKDVPEFLATLSRGKTYLPAFRGRADLEEPEQVAELAALRWAAKAGRPDQDVHLAPGSQTGRQRHYTANVAETRLAITLEARDFTIYGGCDTANGGGIPTLSKRWLVREVAAI